MKIYAHTKYVTMENVIMESASVELVGLDWIVDLEIRFELMMN